MSRYDTPGQRVSLGRVGQPPGELAGVSIPVTTTPAAVLAPRLSCPADRLGDRINGASSARAAASRLLASQTRELATAALHMVRRFKDGGRLLVLADEGAVFDADHVVVEFLHPVIAGARAFPALTLPQSAAAAPSIAHEVQLLGRPRDIALGIDAGGAPGAARSGLAAAREAGLLTMCLQVGAAEGSSLAEHVVDLTAPDPLVAREMCVTAYHLMWELVQVLYEQLDRPGGAA
jgi:D-sedoheptulose 7-phosphate isomerase